MISARRWPSGETATAYGMSERRLNVIPSGAGTEKLHEAPAARGVRHGVGGQDFDGHLAVQPKFELTTTRIS
jgi:hypothetical protein